MRKGEVPWDWRILFNGKFDQMMYDRKRIYQELPFADLKRKSLINEVANSAAEESFGQTIRENLPGFGHGSEG